MKDIDQKYSFGGWLPDAVASGVSSSKALGPSSDTDEYWMKQALNESMLAIGKASPNPPVGCVIVKEGKCISRGHTSAFGGVHAEVMALSNLSEEQARGATAYVTLEPCCHQGQQGPCVEKLVAANLGRCVIGLQDPNPLVAGGGVKRLKDAGIAVSTGVLATPCWLWMSPFCKTVAKDKLFVALKWAQTLDGQLADDQSSSKWISGALARRYTHWLRQKYDLIMVGANTVLADNPCLDVRDSPFINRQPIKLVFDPNGKILRAPGKKISELKQTTFRPSEAKTIYATSAQVDSGFIDECNLEVVSLNENEHPLKQTLQALKGNIHKSLGRPPFQSILVEGGPRLLSLFFKDGYFDCIHAFVAPAILSGSSNRIDSMSPLKSLAEMRRYENVTTAQLGNDILLEMIPTE